MIIEALQYLHYTCRQIHRNICPQAIIVNKRGTWKLFGLEFYENIIGPDPTEMMAVTPWSMKVAKVAQPNLDYQEKQRYNRTQISTRNVIERVNGVLKRRFACLNRKLQNSLENSCHIIVACAVLHNICVKTNEPLIEPELDLEAVPVAEVQDAARAPEIQTNAHCNILSDMFSLGLVICALFNNGKPIIQACNNPMLYLKQIEFLEQQVNSVLEKIPGPLQEAVQRLLNRDPHPRPTTQLLPLIKYFK
ncbi:hypothetical protein JYU34_000291 [Plutella xylostella]|uniref:Protein kinase domain-containing protein n=1 Tax=Plutella xylostella TaxID=51655 RepID=A0ABQ7R7B3_PLUXY|nr:hypothetical protein JYU34_000291 [Plutella xylostella]